MTRPDNFKRPHGSSDYASNYDGTFDDPTSGQKRARDKQDSENEVSSFIASPWRNGGQQNNDNEINRLRHTISDMQTELDLTRKAMIWFMENEVGTPVPTWVDNIVNEWHKQ